jgi:putative transposase
MKWLPLLAVKGVYPLLLNSLNYCMDKYEAKLFGYVLMPNHIHLLLHFETGNSRCPFMRDFKKYTSTQIRKKVADSEPYLLDKLRYEDGKQKFKVWQDRFDEVYLESRYVLERKLNYIHKNPLQEHWRLAAKPFEYPYSSAQFYFMEVEDKIPITHYKEYF